MYFNNGCSVLGSRDQHLRPAQLASNNQSQWEKMDLLNSYTIPLTAVVHLTTGKKDCKILSHLTCLAMEIPIPIVVKLKITYISPVPLNTKSFNLFLSLVYQLYVGNYPTIVLIMSG
uniref:Uncharacterized protein n=1 Tax=Micrurus spixii TaxID=129469 RepID=A0A2D4N8F1_9SAUR